MEPSKTSHTRCEWHHNTFTQWPYIALWQTTCTHHKTLHMLISLSTTTKWTQHSALLMHSTAFHIRHPYLPCSCSSGKFPYMHLTLQQAIQTQHCSYTPQLLHTRQISCLPCMFIFTTNTRLNCCPQWCSCNGLHSVHVTFNLDPPKIGSPRNNFFWNIWTPSEKFVPL